uniref:(northern house mosquito) hypothetical protein n=1 Tax=Culex pipiens TaxID=7175 RepID=A0A8D8L285_CULPI
MRNCFPEPDNRPHRLVRQHLLQILFQQTAKKLNRFQILPLNDRQKPVQSKVLQHRRHRMLLRPGRLKVPLRAGHKRIFLLLLLLGGFIFNRHRKHHSQPPVRLQTLLPQLERRLHAGQTVRAARLGEVVPRLNLDSTDQRQCLHETLPGDGALEQTPRSSGIGAQTDAAHGPREGPIGREVVWR